MSRLTRYGRLLGIAFQIADDLLDIAGDEDATGKSLGTDLQQQKPTLPVIRALELSGDAQRQRLETLLNDPTQSGSDQLQVCLLDFDVMNYTQTKPAATPIKRSNNSTTFPPVPPNNRCAAWPSLSSAARTR